MKANVAFRGKYYLAEQDKRGLGTEADFVIYDKSTEIYRAAWRKFLTTDDMRVSAVKVLNHLFGEQK